jgi:hypothetical protein
MTPHWLALDPNKVDHLERLKLAGEAAQYLELPVYTITDNDVIRYLGASGQLARALSVTRDLTKCEMD